MEFDLSGKNYFSNSLLIFGSGCGPAETDAILIDWCECVQCAAALVKKKTQCCHVCHFLLGPNQTVPLGS